uniref:Selenoprotein K n=1 Tax=Urocitellus parryii TaxID=9999 RepID=A0A8D2HKN8_UROPR
MCSNGQVPEQSSGTLSLITDFFWRTAEFVILFFKTSSRRCENKRGYRNSFIPDSTMETLPEERPKNGRKSLPHEPQSINL